MSVVDACFHLKRHQARFGGKVEPSVRQLRSGPATEAGLDYEAALHLLSRFEFASPELVSRQEWLRNVLFDMAVGLQPFWAKVVPLGRQRVLRIVGEDQVQCFRNAGLIAVGDDDAWRWWDRLAAFFRAQQAEQQLETGRAGELLSLQFERERLALAGIEGNPQWVGIEDNLAGYDVLSYDRFGDAGTLPVYIEVKTSHNNPPRMFFSRAEWEFALSKKEQYRVHFWREGDGVPQVISFVELSKHIPSDNGLGRWYRLLLGFDPGMNLPNSADGS